MESSEKHYFLTEPISKRCIKNEGTKIAKQIRVFLDVQVVFAIAFWGWITCDEFMHRLELSQIFVRNNVNSEAKGKISSENWKSCNYYKLLEQNEGNVGTKYNMNAFFSLKFSLIQRNWMSDCSSAYCDCKIFFCKIMLLIFYLPFISYLKTRWACCPSICIYKLWERDATPLKDSY